MIEQVVKSCVNGKINCRIKVLKTLNQELKLGILGYCLLGYILN